MSTSTENWYAKSDEEAMNNTSPVDDREAENETEFDMTEDKAYYSSQITSSVDYNTFAMCDDVSSSFSNYYNMNYGVAKDYGEYNMDEAMKKALDDLTEIHNRCEALNGEYESKMHGKQKINFDQLEAGLCEITTTAPPTTTTTTKKPTTAKEVTSSAASFSIFSILSLLVVKLF